MSFLKSYYSSVSSYLIGEEQEEPTENIDIPKEEQLTESKSEGWLSGFYNEAYNQTGELWSAVKTDLTEFASVISKDAKSVVVKTASGVKNGLMVIDAKMNENLQDNETEEENKHHDDSNNDNTELTNNSNYGFKATIYKMLDQVGKVLYIPPEDDDDVYYQYTDDDPNGICTRAEARIESLQRERKTFEMDPSSESEIDQDLGVFSEWKIKLNLDDFQSTIAELIRTNQNLFDQYAELVPRVVTHEEFWSRYFYRVAAIKAEETRREILKSRIMEKAEEVKEPTEQSNDWEDTKATTKNDVVTENKPEIVSNENESTNKSDNTMKEVVEMNSDLKMKEKNGVVYVQHEIESSVTSDDNNSPEISSKNSVNDNEQVPAKTDKDKKTDDDESGWDDDLEIDVTEEDIELAKKLTKEDLDDNWDDWS